MHARECVRLLLTIVAVPVTLLALRALPVLLAVLSDGKGLRTGDPETYFWLTVAITPILCATALWLGVWRLRPPHDTAYLSVAPDV